MKRLCLVIALLISIIYATLSLVPERVITVALADEKPVEGIKTSPIKEKPKGDILNPANPNRPIWPHKPWKAGYKLSEKQINEVIPYLIACESRGNSVKILDTNKKHSLGILQIQMGSWNWWSELSGIKGNPMVPDDALAMARWALANGYLHHWSCAYILGILAR